MIGTPTWLLIKKMVNSIGLWMLIQLLLFILILNNLIFTMKKSTILEALTAGGGLGIYGDFLINEIQNVVDNIRKDLDKIVGGLERSDNTRDKIDQRARDREKDKLEREKLEVALKNKVVGEK